MTTSTSSREAIARLRPEPKPEVAADAHGTELRGTVLAEVVAVLEGAGGEILDVAPDVWAGPQWLSTHFVVRRR